LRWEFSFTCAFCLLHEADFSPIGTERLALLQIEHLVARVIAPGLEAIYSNCYLACRLCNVAKRDQPVVDDKGVRLLDPRTDSWSDHFAWAEDELVPLNEHARRTWVAYDLGDPIKTQRRAYRRVFIEQRLRQLAEDIPNYFELFAAMVERGTPEERLKAVHAMARLEEARVNLLFELGHYQAVPRDARTCRCDVGAVSSTIDEGTLEI
jgi:hypothetical protein